MKPYLPYYVTYFCMVYVCAVIRTPLLIYYNVTCFTVKSNFNVVLYSTQMIKEILVSVPWKLQS